MRLRSANTGETLGRGADLEGKFASRRCDLPRFPRLRQQVRHGDRLLLQDQSASFEPRDVEQVADESIHSIDRAPNQAEHLSSLAGILPGILEQRGGAQNRAERISQIVSDNGEHLLARASQLLGGFA
jgi:hypothetical protein